MVRKRNFLLVIHQEDFRLLLLHKTCFIIGITVLVSKLSEPLALKATHFPKKVLVGQQYFSKARSEKRMHQA